MSAVVTLAIIVAMPIVLGSCSSDSGKIDYIPVKESKSDKWGLMSPNGEFLFVDEFENTPTIVREGIFSVQEGEDDLWTIYKADKKPQPIKDCEGLKSVGMMSEGLMPIVKKGERITVIDNTGKTKFEIKPIKDQEVVCAWSQYNNGMLQVQTEEGKWGFIDKSGNVKIKPEYDYVNSFLNDYAIVAVKEKNDTTSYNDNDLNCFVIDKNGEIIYQIKKEYKIKYITNKYIVVSLDDRLKILDYKGNEIAKCPAKVSRITDMSDKYYVFVSDEKYGAMNLQGEVIVRAKYEHIQILENENFACIKEDNKGCEILDKKGDVVKSLDVENIIYIPGFGIMAGDSNDLYMISETGEKIGNKSIYEFSFKESKAVYSDYFDPLSASNAIVKLFTDDTLVSEGVKLGVPATNIKMLTSKDLSNLSNYSSNYYWDISETRNYNLKGVLNFNAYFKLNDYGFDNNNNWYDRHYLNPEATIDIIGAQMRIKKDNHATSVGQGVISALKASGAKETFSRSSGSLLTKGDVLYAVLWDNSDNEVYAFECSNNATYSDNLKEMIDRIDQNNKNERTSEASDVFEDVALVDTVAVEEVAEEFVVEEAAY